MPLRDILKKRDHFKFRHKDKDAEKAAERAGTPAVDDEQGPEVPFTFLRTTTATQEQIYPPDFPDDNTKTPPKSKSPRRDKSKSPEPSASPATSPSRYRPALFKKRSGASITSTSSTGSYQDVVPSAGSPSADSPASKKSEHRLSARLEKLHLGRSSRVVSGSSVHVPAELPDIPKDGVDETEKEAEWERRAALLAVQNHEAMKSSPALAAPAAGGDGTTEGGGGKEKVVDTEDDVSNRHFMLT